MTKKSYKRQIKMLLFLQDESYLLNKLLCPDSSILNFVIRTSNNKGKLLCNMHN